MKARKEALQKDHKQRLLSQYGGTEHLDAPPKELLLAQTETYVEYGPDGRMIKGPEKAIPRSIYPEDGTCVVLTEL